MTDQLTDRTVTPTAAAADVVGVTVPPGGIVHQLRAMSVVWRRDMIRFSRDRLRIVTSFIQPVLFLFVLGSGLSSLARAGLGGVDFRTFMFPGALCMSVLFTAMFSAGSIVWDREFGFLREMMVAPINRGSIVLGKALGGATVASAQGVLILCLAGAVGVPYSPTLILTVLGELILLSFTLTAFGLMAAARITQFQAFMALTQMLLMPLFFLSGALFPLSGLPAWLSVLTRVNPLSYAVDPIRRAIFAHLQIAPAVRERLAPGVSWGGWHVPVGAELGIVAAMAAVMVAIAVVEFRHTSS